MKVLVSYHDNLYLIRSDDSREVDYDRLFDVINDGRWPDECQPKEWIIRDSKIIGYFTDESRLIGEHE